MPLPVKFTNTLYYQILGQYTYAGDLVLVPRTLYFFPQVDLEAERNKRSQVGRHFGIAGFALTYIAATAIKTGYGSYLENHGLWGPGITAEQFRQLADAHIAQVRSERTTATFSEHLPFPTCIQVDEISQAKTGATGTLSFYAQSDNHDFKVGFRRKKQLRDALGESGVVKV
jgi:hypothetical protein